MSRTRVLIIRPDNIGDVLLFSGALRHIRALYPGAHITLAVKAHIVNLVELCPYVDACVPDGRLTWQGRMEHAALPFKQKLVRAVRFANKLWNRVRRPYDIVLYPVKSPQIAFLDAAFFLHARETIGITGCSLHTPKKGYPAHLEPKALFTRHLDVAAADPWAHELLTTRDFLQLLGCRDITLDDIKPELWLAKAEKNHLEGIQGSGRKIIGLFPGASWEGRCWKAGNYGKLASLLGGRPVYVIFGGSADKALADRVARAIGEGCDGAEVLNLTGRTTLRELAKTMMACDLFIGMETSGLHMAVAAGVPVIGIVGGGHFGRFIPWGVSEKTVFMTKKMDCFNCLWRCNKEEVECVQGVSPQEVAQAAARLLDPEDMHANSTAWTGCRP